MVDLDIGYHNCLLNSILHMNKRCIVNVATGDFYCKQQKRLRASLKNIDAVYYNGSCNSFSNSCEQGIDLMLWTDQLPPGSKPHSESPYGFKVHAIKYAYERGYTSILWLDSSAHAVKEDVSPIFEKIEKEGYYVMSHIDPLENWVGNVALKYYNIDRSLLLGHNLPSGSCYGFDLTKDIIKVLFSEFEHAEERGLFKSEILSETSCHRHDEAILALLMHDYGIPVFYRDPLFQSDSPECVIKSGGDWEYICT